MLCTCSDGATPIIPRYSLACCGMSNSLRHDHGGCRRWRQAGAHVRRGLARISPSSRTMPTPTLFADPSMPSTNITADVACDSAPRPKGADGCCCASLSTCVDVSPSPGARLVMRRATSISTGLCNKKPSTVWHPHTSAQRSVQVILLLRLNRHPTTSDNTSARGAPLLGAQILAGPRVTSASVSITARLSLGCNLQTSHPGPSALTVPARFCRILPASRAPRSRCEAVRTASLHLATQHTLCEFPTPPH